TGPEGSVHLFQSESQAFGLPDVSGVFIEPGYLTRKNLLGQSEGDGSRSAAVVEHPLTRLEPGEDKGSVRLQSARIGISQPGTGLPGGGFLRPEGSRLVGSICDGHGFLRFLESKAMSNKKPTA